MSLMENEVKEIESHLISQNQVLETAVARLDNIATRLLNIRTEISQRFSVGKSFDDLAEREHEAYSEFMETLQFAFSTILQIANVANRAGTAYLTVIKTYQLLQKEMHNEL